MNVHNVVLDHCSFVNNVIAGAGLGGGLYVSANKEFTSTLDITNCNFTSNTASWAGGAGALGKSIDGGYAILNANNGNLDGGNNNAGVCPHIFDEHNNQCITLPMA